MAKLKMLKAPKAPKDGASVASKQKWIERCKAVQKENARRDTENKKSAALSKQIQAMKAKFKK